MIVSHKHQFIFLKTHKTAGSSIEAFLSGICGAHDVLTELDGDEERFRTGRGAQNFFFPESTSVRLKRELFRLAGCVPLHERRRICDKTYIYLKNHCGYDVARFFFGTRLTDQYYKVTVERNPWDRQVSYYYYWMKYFSKGVDYTFKDFMQNENIARIRNFEVYSYKCRPVAHRIIRYEHLTEGVADFLSDIGLHPDVKLPCLKGDIRPSESRDYRPLYDVNTYGLVERWYGREIALLGYRFDGRVAR